MIHKGITKVWPLIAMSVPALSGRGTQGNTAALSQHPRHRRTFGGLARNVAAPAKDCYAAFMLPMAAQVDLGNGSKRLVAARHPHRNFGFCFVRQPGYVGDDSTLRQLANCLQAVDKGGE